jgi:N-acetylmuramoyl-L-alanine amidase
MEDLDSRILHLKSFRRLSLFPSVVPAALAAVVLVVVSVSRAGGQAPGQGTLTLLSKEGRRTLPLTLSSDQELVFLDDLASLFQLTVREESLGTFTVAYKGKTILLTPDQPLVSIAGRLVSLPAAPMRVGRRWLVPVEFINRALGLVYDARLDLRKPARLLIVGDLRVPRLTMRFEGADPAHLTLDASPRTSSTVSQEANTLTIRFDADALDVNVPAIQPGPILQSVRVQEPATLVVDLGPRFVAFRASTQPLETSTRLTIDLLSTQTQAIPAPGPVAPPEPAFPPPDLSTLSQPAGVRTIALDPGHGGEDEGVKGAGGTKEKDLVLTVARRLKAAIEGRLGIRVLLTRDDDRNVALDGRAAIANNNKADLFISLHANASFRKTTTAASILYASFDREGEKAARASLGSERLPTFGGGLRQIDLVFWDLAQVSHITRSRELAQILESQFRDKIPLAAHTIDRAPLDVLESANMPAVMIEMGYLTSQEDEARMAGADYQNTLVQAVYDAVLRFRDTLTAGTQ